MRWFLNGQWAMGPRNLCPNVSLHTRFLGSQVKTRRTVNPVAIKHSQGRHVQANASRNQILGPGSAFKETESGAGVEFDIHRGTVLGSQFQVEPSHDPHKSARIK